MQPMHLIKFWAWRCWSGLKFDTESDGSEVFRITKIKIHSKQSLKFVLRLHKAASFLWLAYFSGFLEQTWAGANNNWTKTYIKNKTEDKTVKVSISALWAIWLNLPGFVRLLEATFGVCESLFLLTELSLQGEL